MTMPSTTSAGLAAMNRRIGAALQGLSSVARGGFALVLGSLIGSALGVVFWALAARLLSPEQLGLGAALVSALGTLSHASQLNLRNLLHRFVPGAGAAAPRMIRRAYAAAALVAIVLGTGFVVLVAAIVPELAFLGQSPLATAGFVAALLIWTLYALQEAALTALRLAAFVPLQSLVYSASKIACLLVLALMMASGTAILASWVVPALLIGLLTHVLVSRRLSSRPSALTPGETVGWRQIATFFGWDYVGALATSVSLGVAPILVVSLSGAADVAPYYLAWSITYMLYLVSRHVGAAMLAELVANAGRRRALYAEAILLTVLPVSCGVAVVLLFAPQIMLIFGPSYVAAGADTLRILALATIPGSLVTAYLAICRAEGWVRMIALLQIVTLVALLVTGGLLTASLGPDGMAWGWLAANSIAALLLLGSAFARNGVFGALDFAVDLTSAALRLLGQLRAVLPSRNRAHDTAAVQVAGQNWTIDGAVPASLSDVTTLKLRSVDDPTRSAILKRATTPHGRTSLQREHAALLRLRADGAMSAILGNVLPEPIFFEDGTLLMSTLPGTDARAIASQPTEYALAVGSIVETLSALHRVTGVWRVPTTAWMTEWIDEPIARIAAAIDRPRPIALLTGELHCGWGTIERRLGPGHGDFCPDNLLVERDPSTGLMRPSGLVDWGGFQPDAPAGLDACSMALTLRAASSGRQHGQVVLDLLKQPAWTSAELAWLGRGGSEPWLTDAEALRAMVLLAWLQHVDANLGKSARYTATGYWGLANIRVVLEGLAHVAR